MRFTVYSGGGDPSAWFGGDLDTTTDSLNSPFTKIWIEEVSLPWEWFFSD